MKVLQIFNNWSPYLVRDPDTVWMGLEYFCSEGDALWSSSDQALGDLGVRELQQIGIAHPSQVLGRTVIRMPRTYPAYFGTYDDFHQVRHYLDGITNLVLLGRNGMHRYNNQDHSMLTAMVAIDGLTRGHIDRERIWTVNTEEAYHEEQEG